MFPFSDGLGSFAPAHRVIRFVIIRVYGGRGVGANLGWPKGRAEVSRWDFPSSRKANGPVMFQGVDPADTAYPSDRNCACRVVSLGEPQHPHPRLITSWAMPNMFFRFGLRLDLPFGQIAAFPGGGSRELPPPSVCLGCHHSGGCFSVLEGGQEEGVRCSAYRPSGAGSQCTDGGGG